MDTQDCDNSSKHPVIYLGTPDFAVAPLKKLVEDSRFLVKAVLTQPDKPSGRGQKTLPTPVKIKALELGLPVLQPKTLKKLEFDQDSSKLVGSGLADELNSLGNIKAAIVVAYGKIVPDALLSWPEFGAINIHPSLLPSWRGAAPIQHTVFAGDEETGTCIMELDSGLDTGPVYAREKCKVEATDTLGSLHDKLCGLSAQLLVETLPSIFDGSLKAQDQPEIELPYAEKWTKEDASLNWKETAETCDRRIRASTPIPGARTMAGEKLIKILSARPVENRGFQKASSGVVVEINKAEIVVSCSEGSFLSIEMLQFPGKNPVKPSDVLNGNLLSVGDQLS